MEKQSGAHRQRPGPFGPFGRVCPSSHEYYSVSSAGTTPRSARWRKKNPPRGGTPPGNPPQNPPEPPPSYHLLVLVRISSRIGALRPSPPTWPSPRPLPRTRHAAHMQVRVRVLIEVSTCCLYSYVPLFLEIAIFGIYPIVYLLTNPVPGSAPQSHILKSTYPLFPQTGHRTNT